MKSVCAVLVLGFVAFANAKPNGETAGTPETPDLLTSIYKAHEGKLTDNVHGYISNVIKDNPDLKGVLTYIKTGITNTVEGINAKIPEAQKQTAMLHEKLVTGLNAVVEESSKIYETFNENKGTVREDVNAKIEAPAPPTATA